MIFLLLVAALTLASIMLLVKCNINTRSKDSEEIEKIGPVYEEILTPSESEFKTKTQASITMKDNCSYGDIKTIKMTQSPAYDDVFKIISSPPSDL